MKTLTTVFLLLFLSACATTGENFYAEEKVENSAIIKKGGQREGAFSWTSFTLYSVNGKRVPYGFISAPSQTKLAPGLSKIVVLASFNDGAGAPYEAKIPLEIELTPETTYVLSGKVLGARVETWLANESTKEKIGASYSATATRMNLGPTVTRLPAP
jgi:hypothetical protein